VTPTRILAASDGPVAVPANNTNLGTGG
jgi:hypothetical protein